MNVEMQKSKSKYFHNEITHCSKTNDPMHKAWTLINSLLGKNDKSNNLSELLVDNTPVSDPKSIADVFNNYFSSIGSKLAAECTDESCGHEDNQPINFNRNQPSNTSLIFSSISVHNVVSTFRNQKACKATGLDNVPPKILKLSTNIIAPSLTFIFKLSLVTGILHKGSEPV